MPVLDRIGSGPLKDLTARDVRRRLDALGVSTRYLQIALGFPGAGDPVRRGS
jgi:hypothetical protein